MWELYRVTHKHMSINTYSGSSLYFSSIIIFYRHILNTVCAWLLFPCFHLCSHYPEVKFLSALTWISYSTVLHWAPHLCSALSPFSPPFLAALIKTLHYATSYTSIRHPLNIMPRNIFDDMVKCQYYLFTSFIKQISINAYRHMHYARCRGQNLKWYMPLSTWSLHSSSNLRLFK